MLRQTSILAFNHMKETGKLEGRRREVLEGFKKMREATNLELSRFLKLPINQITGRTFDLSHMGYLKAAYRRPCKVSGRLAIVWQPVGNPSCYHCKSFMAREDHEVITCDLCRAKMCLGCSQKHGLEVEYSCSHIQQKGDEDEENEGWDTEDDDD